MSYKVKLPIFEGPFDLLVYLIENSQMSVYDIRISEITGQYIDYITTMRDLSVNVSSEFMVLAAELLRIKTRMMLPSHDPEPGETDVEDPRSDLVSRILEYKRCKAQGEALDRCMARMEDIFSKPQEDISVYTDNPDEYLSLDIDSFAKAFKAFLGRRKRLEETRRRYTIVERERANIETRMLYIKDICLEAFKKGDQSMSFASLVPDQAAREDVVTSFLSVLQMMRDSYLDAEQRSVYGDIYIRKGSRDLSEFARGGKVEPVTDWSDKPDELKETEL